MNDPSKENVRFRGSSAKRLSGIKDKRIFHKVDGAFDGISWNTGIEPEVFVRVGIDALAIGGIRAGVFTGTKTAGAVGERFLADPFKPHGTVLAAGLAKVDKRLSVHRTDWSAGSIESCVLGFGVSWIQRNTGPMEAKVLLKKAVIGIGVESRIAIEGAIGKGGMCGEEI